jgi:arylsulfatase A-like enzyme
VLDQKQAHNYYPTHLWENGSWDSLSNQIIDVHKSLDSVKATNNDFDSFKGQDYSIDKMTAKALGFIELNKDKKFFLYLPFSLPHVSLQVPDEALRQYIGKFQESPYYGQRGYASHKNPRSAYAAMVSYLDLQVGVVMKKISEAGLDSNTIIMFSSDNGSSVEGGADPGFFNATGGLRGTKRDLYEGGVRVPFIVRWPGKIQGGQVTDHISTQYDLLSTLAEITGAANIVSDGISFWPVLSGTGLKQASHEWLYFEFPEKGGQVAIRLGDWKAVRTNVMKNRDAPWQLYNLASDPYETSDVAIQHPDLVRQFDAIQKKEHQHPHIREWEFIDPKFNEK